MTYRRDTIIIQGNGQQFLDIQARLWVRFICECDLYVKIYGMQKICKMQFNSEKRSYNLKEWRLIKKQAISKSILIPIDAVENTDNFSREALEVKPKPGEFCASSCKSNYLTVDLVFTLAQKYSFFKCNITPHVIHHESDDGTIPVQFQTFGARLQWRYIQYSLACLTKTAVAGKWSATAGFARHTKNVEKSAINCPKLPVHPENQPAPGR